MPHANPALNPYVISIISSCLCYHNVIAKCLWRDSHYGICVYSL